MNAPKQVRWVLAVAILLAGVYNAFGADAPADPESLPRFRQVAPGIYRGGQPKERGYEWLKQHGVKTIINLRSERDERRQVESLGLHYVYLPMDARDEISPDAIQNFLSIISDPARQPVFVHCQRGADRTGFMVGVFRIAKQGWTPEQAYDEARDIGMRWWYRGLKRQLFEFAARIHSDTSRASGN
jgi:tyrosine-protein phosphatase SIW14